MHNYAHILRRVPDARIRAFLIRFTESDSGQAISEYLVILGVIVIACILLAVAFQAELATLWGTVTSSMGSI